MMVAHGETCDDRREARARAREHMRALQERCGTFESHREVF
jgi:hypothetical protein